MSTASATLPATLALGPAALTVTDLDRSVAFYEDVIGLDALERAEGRAVVGSGERPVMELVADPDATAPGREAGLYHVALLYPARDELARVAQRIAASGTPIQGASDHHTHEAFYLPDPDGNGLELAADRPREAWPDLQDAYDLTKGAPQPLDVAGLMTLVDGQPVVARAEPGVGVGHLHLHVGDVDAGLAFYRDVIGFDEIANMGTAAFVSAGGYHHHLGFNTWRGEDVPPAADGRLGLREWTVLLPAADVAAMRERAEAAGYETGDRPSGGFTVLDPWRNALAIEPA
jgi:catechol 2,3-dioxygenase